MRKGLFCLLAALLLLSFFSVAAAEEDNLIVNGDFSQVENGLPVGWYTYAYFSDAGSPIFPARMARPRFTTWISTTRAFARRCPWNPARIIKLLAG